MNIRGLLITCRLILLSFFTGLLIFSLGCQSGPSGKDIIKTDDGELLTVEEMWEGMRK